MTRFENYLDHLQRFGIQPGLERVHALLDRFGQPQRQYPVVLVGGTNGKGSTCEFLATMLAAENRTVGLYTSPHLYRWNERIRVMPGVGCPVSGAGAAALRTPHCALRTALFPGVITDDALDALFDAALPHLQAVVSELGQPTEFETLTALGLWHFARARVDIAVVEVGLGGRWDATNATEPAVSVITHVALDHCDRLGDTLEAIASDKVEIARPRRILVTAETKPPVLRVFQDYAVAHQVPLWPYEAQEWSNDQVAMTRALGQLPAAGSEAGDFQILNLRTSMVTRAALAPALGWPMTVSQRVPARIVPGRAEVLRQQPLALIDGANNPDGAERLAGLLRERLADGTAPRRLILVLGILADKDHAAMVQTLAPLAHVVIATQSHSPRAARAEAIATEARRYCPHVETVTPVAAAVRRALDLASPTDIICVTGSFYTIAEVERGAVTASNGKD